MFHPELLELVLVVSVVFLFLFFSIYVVLESASIVLRVCFFCAFVFVPLFLFA